jgi:hypothetical protein
MKKEYFISDNGEKKGAFTFEELIKMDIYDTHLIWKAGWDDWKKADTVDELENYILFTPPLTLNERQIHQKKEELNDFRSAISGNIKVFFTLLISITFVLNLLVYIIASQQINSNHSVAFDSNPIYLSSKEIASPSLIFFNQLPTSFIIALVLSSIIYAVYILQTYKK